MSRAHVQGISLGYIRCMIQLCVFELIRCHQILVSHAYTAYTTSARDLDVLVLLASVRTKVLWHVQLVVWLCLLCDYHCIHVSQHVVVFTLCLQI